MRFLCSLLLLSLVACGPAKPPYSHRTLNLNLFTDPSSLDPRLADGMGGNTVVLELFEGLTRIDQKGHPSLALAEGIELSEDGLDYTFTLRPSSWSNGDPLTADDFVFAWKQALDPMFPAEFAYLLFELRGAREAKTGEGSLEDVGVWSEGPHTLHVRLTHPAPYFLHLLTNSMYFPVNRQISKAHPNWAHDVGPGFVCNGPFKLTQWRHGSEIEVEANPHFWDHKRVAIEKIHHIMVDNATTEINLFEQGELDWAGGPMSMLSYDALPALRRHFQVEQFAIDAVYWYHLNTDDPLLRNAKIRRALAYSIKRDELVTNLAKGAHLPATGLLPPPLAPTSIDYFEEKSDEEVRTLFQEGLVELGLEGKRLKPLKISTNISEDHLKLAQALQERWQQLFGLSVSLEIAEWRVHLDKLQQGLYQVGRLGWYANFRDGVDFLNRFRYPTCHRAASGWEQSEFATLVDQLDWCEEPTERQKLIAQAEAMLMEEMPVIPIFFLNFNYIKHPQLQEVVFSPFGRVDFRWAFWVDSV